MGFKGVNFDNTHSFYDLNLVLSTVTIPPAKAKTTYVDISGSDSTLDLTEALGETRFKDKDIKLVFTVHPSSEMSRDEKQAQVANAIHGKRCKITLDRDSGYFWDGRCVVSDHKEKGKIHQITVTATVKPYKLKQNKTVSTFVLSSVAQTVVLKNERKSVVPTIECTSDNVEVVFNGNTYTLNAGTHRILDICLKAGDNILKLTGSGTITFTYQEGAL